MGRHTILIVDDEKDLVSMVKMRLEAAGYDTIEAYDGQEALTKAQNKNPDLIILDLMLPKMDGYKVCRMLKFDSRYKSIPIILFTARAQDSDKDLGKEVGADAYIAKPFDSEALLAKVKELLS